MRGTADRIPKGARLYITTDIDGFCPSIASGTGAPSLMGRAQYCEVLEVLRLAAQEHGIVGIDLVEVAPAFDPTDGTSILAARGQGAAA